MFEPIFGTLWSRVTTMVGNSSPKEKPEIEGTVWKRNFLDSHESLLVSI